MLVWSRLFKIITALPVTRFFASSLENLLCFIPQGGKGTVLYEVQLSSPFNLLYMNIYTLVIRSLI